MIGSWPRLITVVAARILLFGILGLAFWATAPMLLGWTPTTVVTGSMRPAIQVGDVVVSQDPDGRQLRPGQVLLVDDPDQRGKLRLHRIDSQQPSGEIILKGDANAKVDSTPIPRESVRGVGTLRVPFIGAPIVWLRERAWLPLLVTGLGVAGLIALAFGRFARSGTPSTPAGESPSGTPGSGQRDSADREATDRDAADHDAAGPGTHHPDTPNPDATRPDSHPRTPGRGRRGRHRGIAGAAAGTATVTALLATAAVAIAPAHAMFSDTTSRGASFTSAAAPPYRDVVLADQPLAFYEAETTDPAKDSTGQSPTRSYGVTVAQGAGREPGGGALNLSAPLSTQTLTTFRPDPGPREFTLELWMKTTASGGRLIGFGGSAEGASGLYDRVVYLSGGRLFFGVGPWGPTMLVTAGTFNDGNWHHVVAARDAAGTRLVVDGKVISGPPGETQNYGGYWRIGYDNLGGWRADPLTTSFNGLVDDVAIYPRALTADQAIAHYQAGRPG
ncbi:LamG-like jellyroll fold domain-containing protein [Nakamurella aerolata]|uniref:Signal peptidase I n=1 Tax=Nakamurella aerolata TaxID=1656892 RepID=A0A849A737_9ACTN|nr:hypothetical protein [Nakamurella aerolata]